MRSSISYILDCDGVILDSNNLKIEVAEEVLLNMSKTFPVKKVSEALESFKKTLVDQGIGMLNNLKTS